MCTPYYEISRYGIRRLRKIARFLKHGGTGYEALFGETAGWRIEYGPSTPKQVLVDRISNSGAFQYISYQFHHSWERFLASVAMDKNSLTGLCNIFGMEGEVTKLTSEDVSVEDGISILQKVVNKLSIVYTFPGDPVHPLSRKRMNDIRLNALFRRNIFGTEPLNIARAVRSFKEAMTDPVIRTVFWSCYVPGTGRFAISVSNLDQITETDDCCSICMDDFDIHQPGICLNPCQHVFHPRCIQALILSIGDSPITCPLCRSKVVDLGTHG